MAAALVRGALLCGSIIVIRKLTGVLYKAFLTDKIHTEASQREREDQSATTTTTMMNLEEVGREFERSVIDEGNQIRERIKLLLKQASYLRLNKGVPTKPLQRLHAPLVVKESDVVGRDGDKEEIIALLLSHDAGGKNLSVIPIVGMGGLGKTTLAQLVYEDSRIQQHFASKVWVTVSEDFNSFQITKAIVQKVSSLECSTTELRELQSKLNEVLRGKRFLLVLDDVWNENYPLWDSLKSGFQSGADGSAIIVTTRSEVVALTMSKGVMHKLKLVSDKDCWRIFEKHAFDDSAEATAELIEIGHKIVERCKGLPLAVKSVAGLLRSTSNTEEWRQISDSDIWQLQFQDNVKNNIVPALWLSYHFLPPALKRCFAYCSIFPKDYEFYQRDMEQIIWLWMAEGLLIPEKGKRMEDVGKAYLRALKSRSFFQPSGTDKSVMVMHDLVHDLAMFISGEFCFSCDDSNDLSNLGTKSCHLSYRKGKEMKLGAVSQSRQKKLRTLLALPLSSGYGCIYIPISELHELFLKVGGCLRVLSLSESLITELPDSIGNMKYLRYLDLSGTPIEELPDSICTFYNLQTLLLSECGFLVRLPTRLAALVNLCHLDIHGSDCIKEMPPQMWKMKSLQTLSDFVLGENDSWRIKELGEFPLLEGRLRISVLEYIVDVKDVLEANLKDKKFLTQLILAWGGDSNITSSQQEREVLEALQPHTNLKKLTIIGYRGTIFPDWVGHESFCNMVEVDLLYCRNVWMLPPLGQLSSLRRLWIKGLNGVVSIGNEFCGSSSTTTNHPFTFLEYLQISYMGSWEEWSFSSARLGQEGGVFPSLTKLEISDCKKLIVGLPDCHLPSLKSIDIRDCDEMEGVFVCQGRQETDTNAFPSLQSIKILRCKKLIVGLPDCHLPSLKNIDICDCDEMEGVFVCQSRQETDTNAFPSLQSIKILRCKKLIVGLPDCHLPSLKNIDICDCDEMEGVFVCQSRQETDTNAFPSLQSISIDTCKKLIVGLPDCHLPSLKSIDIRDCDEMESVFVCQSCQETDTNAFPSLQSIEILRCKKLIVGLHDCHLPFLKSIDIRDCDEMEGVFVCQNRQETDTNAFPSLQSVEIFGCKKLMVGLPDCHLPSLTKLCIWDCDEMERVFVCQSRQEMDTNAFPSLQFIEIRGCKKLMVGLPDCHLPSLTELRIWDCDEMERVFVCQSRQEMDTNAFPSLQSIKIFRCKKLIVGLPDCHLPSLTELCIEKCDEMEGVFVCQSRQETDTNAFPSLQSISIDTCKKLIVGLPDCHLPSLKSIDIRDCDEMESIFVCQSRQETDPNAFPSLQSIEILRCKKLIVGLPDCHLPSLKSIDIRDCDEMEGVFVCQSHQETDTNAFPSLQSIKILRCKKLIVGLPDCHLPSLKSIDICECDEMEGVFVCQSRQETDTSAFPSLQSISIDTCKKLMVGLPDCHLPSLKSIYIRYCDEMEGVFVCQNRQETNTNAFPSLESFEIFGFKKLIVGLPDCHFPSLKSIYIRDCDEMESVFVSQSRQETDTNAFPSLQSISIGGCKKLMVGLPDCHLPSLKSIDICECDEMEGVFVCQSRQETDTNAFPSLQSISIDTCKKLIVGLPDCHLPSLTELHICDCDEMEGVFICQSRQETDTNAFPSLESIEIRGCKKLIVGLPDCHLPSLKSFDIRDCDEMEGVFVCQSRQETDTNAFPSLQSISINTCKKLMVGLPDCHFPSLTKLCIWDCDEMERVFVCQSRQEMDTNAFPSLQSIEIFGCKKLMVGLPDCHLPFLKSIDIRDCDEMESVFVCQSRQETDTNAFPSLQSIKILRCKKLIVGLPDCYLPSLKSIDIRDCDEMEGVFVCQSRQETDTNAFPSLQSIKILRCKKLIVGLPDCHLPSLKSIDICECDEMEGVFVCQSRQETDTNAFPSLQSISIDTCKKLMVGLPDCHLPSLTKLCIWDCDEMERVFVCQSRQEMDTNAFPSLQSIEIFECKKLMVGLPDCHLPSLTELRIWDCDEMEHVFLCQSRQEMDTNAFPSLQSIEILICKKLWGNRMKWGLERLPSLMTLGLCLHRIEEEVDSFPEEGLLPTTLTKLSISSFAKLKGLNGKAFQHLTSLKNLEIVYCGELECLPQEGLPLSLSSLRIDTCSEVLKQRCQRGTGEDWPKIQHIPEIHIW